MVLKYFVRTTVGQVAEGVKESAEQSEPALAVVGIWFLP